jgi:tripartite-type tricarboxylate transporter receptor subunit TctC
MFRSTAVVAALLFAGATGVGAEPADTYPSRVVEFVVPFPAGGSADVIARMASQIVSEQWKQPVVTQNKSGATGALGTELVARANPDGYTLLMATGSTFTVLPAFRPDLPYDPIASFSPATIIATFPNVLVVNPKKVTARTVAELIDYVKKNPGKLNFASTGIGGSAHFTGEMFKLMTGTQITHVPYRGGGPALQDLVAGTVDLTFDNMATVWPQVQQGTLRALGVASRERTPLAPDLPTIAETVPGFEAVAWVGVAAPAGTPKPIVDKIASAYAKAAKQPDLQGRMADLGATGVGNTPEEFTAFLRADRARWERVAKDANLKAQQ